MKLLVRNLIHETRGQDLIEYSLLMAFVVFTSAGLIWAFGGSVAGVVNITNSNLSAANQASS